LPIKPFSVKKINVKESLYRPGQAWTGLDRPGQAWTGLEGSKSLGLPDVKTIGK